MRRASAALVLALSLSLLGCEALRPGEPVELLTGWGPFDGGGACYANFVVGQLVVDAQYSTALRADTGPGEESVAVPVLWRPGFTGRRFGDVVVVYDKGGEEVARTGSRYRIAGGWWAETLTPTKENHYHSSGPSVFVACDSVHPA